MLRIKGAVSMTTYEKRIKATSTSRKDPETVSIRLAESMRASPVRTDANAAKKFLSRLSMYDQNGKLKR